MICAGYFVNKINDLGVSEDPMCSIPGADLLSLHLPHHRTDKFTMDGMYRVVTSYTGHIPRQSENIQSKLPYPPHSTEVHWKEFRVNR